MAERYLVGLMSGTSADGIDAVLAKIDNVNTLEVLDTLFCPYSENLRHKINQEAFAKKISQCSDSPLHEELAEHYADACLRVIQKFGIDKKLVSAVANHGQTVRHEPNANPAFSLQLGDPQKIANITGLLTIAEFRQTDAD